MVPPPRQRAAIDPPWPLVAVGGRRWPLCSDPSYSGAGELPGRAG